MEKPFFLLCMLAAAAAPLAVRAADERDITEIRQEIKAIKEGYEARLQALEARLKEAEAKAEQVAQSAALAANPSRQSAGAAFNPAISLVLQGRYANLSRDPERFAISGFIPSGGSGPGKRGFSLAETELTLSANVDDKFFGQTTLAVTPENEISVEEAYALATGLPAGLTLKAGRLLSGIGYQNEQHQHVWDFIDAPLAYQVFLGGQFRNDGLQLKWVAPTDLFFELGAEAGNGQNFPGTRGNKNGSGSAALIARLGGDIGYSSNWRVGLSALRTRAENREFTQAALTGNAASNSFTGSTRLAIADFIFKYAPNGNPLRTNFKLQGEYFRRAENGELTFDADGRLGLTNTDAYRSSQTGWYLQGVYQFVPRWRVGLRYDRLNPGTVALAGNAANLDTPSFKPYKATLMFDWSPSEFSRIRLQAARDHSQPGATDNQLFLHYIMTLGAHGAHKF
ncbi:MAG: hypothetical protein H0U63_01020 [Burkholderiales bacterium]|nr:hypothetical protein [Burkholderiales bacterium]